MTEDTSFNNYIVVNAVYIDMMSLVQILNHAGFYTWSILLGKACIQLSALKQWINS